MFGFFSSSLQNKCVVMEEIYYRGLNETFILERKIIRISIFEQKDHFINTKTKEKEPSHYFHLSE